MEYLPVKTMTYHKVAVNGRVRYNRAHLDSAVLAAARLTHKSARLYYVYATANGYTVTTQEPTMQRVVITSLNDDDSVTATLFEPVLQ
jgi:hypothetical protein